MVKIPHELAISWKRDSSIQKLIQETFLQLKFHTWDASYMIHRGILTLRNEDVEKLNDMIIDHFLGDIIIYCHFTRLKETRNLYQQEHLYSIVRWFTTHFKSEKRCIINVVVKHKP